MLAKQKTQFISALQLPAAQLLDLLQATDAFRREERFLKFLTSVAIITLSPLEAGRLRSAFEAAKQVNPQKFVQDGAQGPQIAALFAQNALIILIKLLSANYCAHIIFS